MTRELKIFKPQEKMHVVLSSKGQFLMPSSKLSRLG
jgi:hypothetical protein